MRERVPWWKPFEEAFRATIAIVCHTLVGAVLVVCVWGFEHLFEVLWDHGKEPLILDRVPLRYVMEGGEALVMVVFIIYGTISAIRAFKE